MRRFCFNRCFKGWFSTHVKVWKIRDLTRIVLAIAEYDSNDTPLYNPQGLPLSKLTIANINNVNPCCIANMQIVYKQETIWSLFPVKAWLKNMEGFVVDEILNSYITAIFYQQLDGRASNNQSWMSFLTKLAKFDTFHVVSLNHL